MQGGKCIGVDNICQIVILVKRRISKYLSLQFYEILRAKALRMTVPPHPPLTLLDPESSSG